MKPGLHERRRASALGYAASIAMVLVLWQYGSNQAGIPLLFPSPLSTWRVAVQLANEGRLVGDVIASLSRIAAGFAIGSVLGIALGVSKGSFRAIRLLFEPYVQFFRSLPALA